MEGEKRNIRYNKNLWKKETIIKDAVHGYISVPKPIMREIIDTETFQRLKNIEQTGMEALYPSATHNRFTHSLGVYHLSKTAFAQFRKNVKADFEPIYDEVKNRFVRNADDVWDRWELMFQLASLLHDCGHAPFSHTLEFIYDLPVDKTLNDRLVENMNFRFKEDVGYNLFIDSKDTKNMCGAPHERMSAFFIKTKGQDFFRDRVECLLKDYVWEFMPESNVYDKGEELFKDDIEFMIRMIIGCKYSFDKANEYKARKFYSDRKLSCWETELQLRNCIINMLNSKLDVDNLDYVIRDSKYSGYANQNVDVERLLSSLTIVTAFELKNVQIDKGDRLDCCVNLSEFKGNYIDARISGACHIASHSHDIEANGNVYLDGEVEKESVIQRSFRTSEKFSAQVAFSIKDSDESAEIIISPLCDSDKKGDVCYLNIRGSLDGIFSGTILKNEVELPAKWKINGHRRIFPAYYQNSMSVLMSAIEGSNFEKKWVYSHQISTFTNNYLNIYLLEKYAQILMNRELTVYNQEFEKMISDLNNGVLKREVNISENELVVTEQRLCDKIKSNFLEEQEKLLKILKNMSNRNDVNVFDKLVDIQITYKKVYGENHDGLQKLIYSLENKNNFFDEKQLSVLKIFNDKYMRLRGRETQYFWDIVAMCEHKTIMKQNFFKSCDEDLVALYKQEFLKNVDDETDVLSRNAHVEFSENFEYLLKRNFMRCMWKSYPEYQFYFQDWTDTEKAALREFLKPHTVPAGFEYLVLSDTIGESRVGKQQKRFWEYLKEEYKLKRFVSVNQVIKTKQFVPYETYMKRGEQVVRLEDIKLFNSVKKDEEFCFFYYEQNQGGKAIDIVAILNWLKKEIAVYKKKDDFIGEFKEERMKSNIIIRDNIYGNICIPYKIRRLVDCKEFQRLRRITQLATASQVFPGAVQNRFSHSLGVYYLMDKIITHFEEKLRDIGYENSINKTDRDAVLVAALLHDIGHGPFSHAFEEAGINYENFSHEQWTQKIILSKKTDIHQTLKALWGKEFPYKVMSYIDCRNNVKEGKVTQNELSKQGLNLKFIFASLVSSQLDADRMDYLLRDSHACGVTYGQFDLERIIQGMSIAISATGELKVGIEEEYLSNVEEYFYARYLMYNNIYYHSYKVFTEKLLQNILQIACTLYIKGALKVNALPPILGEIFNHATMSLRDFCDLDDHVVMGAIQTWANLKGTQTEVLATVCKCFLNRKGYRKLHILNPEGFCRKLKKETHNRCDVLNPLPERIDFVYCTKKVQMYKTDMERDVYIIRQNGTIVKLQDIKNIMNLENEESVLYHSMELTEKFFPEDKEIIEQLIREFDINNSVEIEKKYVLNEEVDKEEVLQRILDIAKGKKYVIKESEPKEQEDIYYDTNNGTLREHDFSVRIRKKGTDRYITCKYKMQSESNGEGGQLERFEAERIIDSDNLLDNKEYIDEAVVNLLHAANYEINDLLECIRVTNHRKKCIIYKDNSQFEREDEKYELVLDDVTYENVFTNKKAKEVQIEIELKSGYETRINMKQLTDAIEIINEITSIADSKYNRAFMLTQ